MIVFVRGTLAFKGAVAGRGFVGDVVVLALAADETGFVVAAV